MQTSVHLCNWFWWRNRSSILIMLGSVIIAQASFWIWGAVESLPESLIVISIAASCLSALTVFTFGSDLDLTSGKSAFPQWLFGMPVASTRLAMIPVFAMVLALAWGWIPAASAMKYSMLQTSNTPSPSYFDLLILPWFGLCAFATWMQAIAWWPFRRAWIRLVCLGGLVFGIIFLNSIGFWFGFGKWYATTATLVPAIAGFMAAVFSATRARHLTWRSEAESVGIFDPASGEAASLPSLVKSDFASSVAAIAWRDWKQLGRAPFMLMLMLCVPVALCVVFLPSTIHLIVFMLFVPGMMLVMVSPMLGKSRYWKDNYALSTYLCGLPVSDEQFVFSRIVNTLKTTVAIWGCSLGLALVWLIRQENRNALVVLVKQLAGFEGVDSGWWGILAALAVAFYFALAAPWPGLSIGLLGRKWVKTLTLVALGFGGVILFVNLVFLLNRLMPKLNNPYLRGEVLQSIWEYSRYWVGAILVLKALLIAASIRIAWRRKLIGSQQLVFWAPILFAAFAVVLGIFVSLLTPFGIPVWDIVMVIGVTFPVTSFIASRIALDWNRHR